MLDDKRFGFDSNLEIMETPIYIDNLRINKRFLFVYVLFVSSLVIHFGKFKYSIQGLGYGITVFNPVINTFILKFEWT